MNRQHRPDPIHAVPYDILADAYPDRSITTCGGGCGLAWLGFPVLPPKHLCTLPDRLRHGFEEAGLEVVEVQSGNNSDGLALLLAPLDRHGVVTPVIEVCAEWLEYRLQEGSSDRDFSIIRPTWKGIPNVVDRVVAAVAAAKVCPACGSKATTETDRDRMHACLLGCLSCGEYFIPGAQSTA